MTAPARSALARAENDPAGLSDEAYVDLLAADGEELEALAELADEVRREVVGDQLTFVANRNLDTAGRPRPRARRRASSTRPGRSGPPRSACRARCRPTPRTAGSSTSSR